MNQLNSYTNGRLVYSDEHNINLVQESLENKNSKLDLPSFPTSHDEYSALSTSYSTEKPDRHSCHYYTNGTNVVHFIPEEAQELLTKYGSTTLQELGMPVDPLEGTRLIDRAGDGSKFDAVLNKYDKAIDEAYNNFRQNVDDILESNKAWTKTPYFDEIDGKIFISRNVKIIDHSDNMVALESESGIVRTIQFEHDTYGSFTMPTKIEARTYSELVNEKSDTFSRYDEFHTPFFSLEAYNNWEQSRIINQEDYSNALLNVYSTDDNIPKNIRPR